MRTKQFEVVFVFWALCTGSYAAAVNGTWDFIGKRANNYCIESLTNEAIISGNNPCKSTGRWISGNSGSQEYQAQLEILDMSSGQEVCLFYIPNAHGKIIRTAILYQKTPGTCSFSGGTRGADSVKLKFNTV